jgi:hypothetical protein
VPLTESAAQRSGSAGGALAACQLGDETAAAAEVSRVGQLPSAFMTKSCVANDPRRMLVKKILRPSGA